MPIADQHQPVVRQRRTSTVQCAQWTIEVPRVRSTNDVMDVPAVKQRRVSTTTQTARDVEVPRVIPQELVRPAGERASVRERVRQFEMDGGAPRLSTLEFPRAAPSDRWSQDSEGEAPNKRRKQERDPHPQILVHFSLCDDLSDLEAQSVAESAEFVVSKRSEEGRQEGLSKKLDDVMLELRDVRSDIVQVRELVGVLVRRERFAETKAEIATRKLARMEKEKDEESEAEYEGTLEEALTNQSKVVKVIVDKWFVDKGFGFGKTSSGEIVFIHASAVQGAEVLKIGTDARVQVENDDARAQGGYRARRAWGQDVWKAEKDKERATKVAQQVRRAAALTAELAAQSEKKVSAVCDQPPGLRDEPAMHIEAPTMGAGGSHNQAEMMQEAGAVPVAESNPFAT